MISYSLPFTPLSIIRSLVHNQRRFTLCLFSLVSLNFYRKRRYNSTYLTCFFPLRSNFGIYLLLGIYFTFGIHLRLINSKLFSHLVLRWCFKHDFHNFCFDDCCTQITLFTCLILSCLVFHDIYFNFFLIDISKQVDCLSQKFCPNQPDSNVQERKPFSWSIVIFHSTTTMQTLYVYGKSLFIFKSFSVRKCPFN